MVLFPGPVRQARVISVYVAPLLMVLKLLDVDGTFLRSLWVRMDDTSVCSTKSHRQSAGLGIVQ